MTSPFIEESNPFSYYDLIPEVEPLIQLKGWGISNRIILLCTQFTGVNFLPNFVVPASLWLRHLGWAAWAMPKSAGGPRER
jgi:hypothetical protein